MAGDDSSSSDKSMSNPNVGSPADRNTGKKNKENRGGWQGGLAAAGRSWSAMGKDFSDSAREEAASSIRPVQYRKGGKVRKTGPAILHKNERVIPAGKRKKVERMMKRSKMRMKAR